MKGGCQECQGHEPILIIKTACDINHRVVIEAYKLPGRFHKDPADRLLVATARLHDLTLVTADERILAYRLVQTLDARR